MPRNPRPQVHHDSSSSSETSSTESDGSEANHGSGHRESRQDEAVRPRRRATEANEKLSDVKVLTKMLDYLIHKRDDCVTVNALARHARQAKNRVRKLASDCYLLMIHGGQVAFFDYGRQLRLCQTHLEIPGSCDAEQCRDMHICPDFLLDACVDASCSKMHKVGNHNRKLLERFGLKGVPDQTLVGILAILVGMKWHADHHLGSDAISSVHKGSEQQAPEQQQLPSLQLATPQASLSAPTSQPQNVHMSEKHVPAVSAPLSSHSVSRDPEHGRDARREPKRREELEGMNRWGRSQWPDVERRHFYHTSFIRKSPAAQKPMVIGISDSTRDADSKDDDFSSNAGATSKLETSRSASPSHSVSRDAHGHNRRQDAVGRNLLDEDDDRRSVRSQFPPRRHVNQQHERKPPARRQQSVPRRRQPERPAHVEASDSTSSDSSSEAEGIPSSGARSKPVRRRALSPAFSAASSSRRGAGNSAEPVIINPNLDQFAVPVKKLTKEERDETCDICMGKLKEESPYEDAYMNNRAVIRLRCGHALHHHCAVEMLSHQAEMSFMKCLNCDHINRTRFGDQPGGGRMIVRLEKPDPHFRARSHDPYINLMRWLRGDLHASTFPTQSRRSALSGTGTIVIEYQFKDGVQGPNHPSPGSRYLATGFPRIAYLPRTTQGYEVLCMLKIAFERRLIFTIGTSSSTGIPDTLIWAGIEHKTSECGVEFGYPDGVYLDRVTAQLKAVGITPADIPPNPSVSLDIGF